MSTKNIRKSGFTRIIPLVLFVCLAVLVYAELAPTPVTISGDFDNSDGMSPMARVIVRDQTGEVVTSREVSVIAKDGRYYVKYTPPWFTLSNQSFVQVCLAHEDASYDTPCIDYIPQQSDYFYRSCPSPDLHQGLRAWVKHIFSSSEADILLSHTDCYDFGKQVSEQELNSADEIVYNNIYPVREIIREYYPTNHDEISDVNVASADDQQLQLNGTIISIENGNSVDLSDLLGQILSEVQYSGDLPVCTKNNQVLQYSTIDPDGTGPQQKGWNCEDQVAPVNHFYGGGTSAVYQNLAIDGTDLTISGGNTVSLSDLV